MKSDFRWVVSPTGRMNYLLQIGTSRNKDRVLFQANFTNGGWLTHYAVVIRDDEVLRKRIAAA